MKFEGNIKIISLNYKYVSTISQTESFRVLLGHVHSFYWGFCWKIQENTNYANEARIVHTPFPVKPLAATLSFHSALPKTSVLAS